MEQLIDTIINSQAPWMVLSVVLVIFLVKLQNDKLLELCKSVAALAILYQKHDERAIDIKTETNYIKEWCISKGGSVDCIPSVKREQ